MLKITGFFGGKKAVKGLSAFCLIVFGIPALLLSFKIDSIRPLWVYWVFLGGVVLSLTLLIGSSFASDIVDEK